MKNAKIILARYKKGIMSKSDVLNYLNSCGMDDNIKEYIKSQL